MRWTVRLLILLIFLSAVPGRASTEDIVPSKNSFELVCDVYRGSGAKLREIKMELWGQINNRTENDSQLEEKYQVVAESLGLDPRRKCLQKDQNGFVSLSQLEEVRGGSWQICLQTVPIDKTRADYLAVMFITDSVERAQEALGKMEICLRELGENLIPGITFKCDWPNMTERQAAKENLMALAKTYGAEFVEGMEDGKITSLAFYNKLYKPWLVVNGRKINLHLAVSYNNLENMTELFIGSPLIYQEY